MQSLETKIKNMRYNLKAYDKPELINAFDLPEEKFRIDEDREHIVRDVINYFKQDPKVWSLPAKNIFVRICYLLFCGFFLLFFYFNYIKVFIYL